MERSISNREELRRPAESTHTIKPTGRGMPSTAAGPAGELRPSSPATPPPFPDRLNSVPGRPPKRRLELRLYTGCDWMESPGRGRRVEQSLPGSAVGGGRRDQRAVRFLAPYGTKVADGFNQGKLLARDA